MVTQRKDQTFDFWKATSGPSGLKGCTDWSIPRGRDETGRNDKLKFKGPTTSGYAGFLEEKTPNKVLLYLSPQNRAKRKLHSG